MAVRYLVAWALSLPVVISEATRRVVDAATHKAFKFAYHRLHQRGHYVAFDIARCMGLAFCNTYAHTTVRIEETLGAIGLWVMGHGWQGSALRDTVPAKLEWYSFGLLAEISRDLLLELRRGRPRP